MGSRKLTVDKLISELLKIQAQGKGHYMIVPIVFDDGEHGHFSGYHESWLNGVKDDGEEVYIGGR